MKTPFVAPCDACQGKPMVDPETGEQGPCAVCGGTGRVRGVRGPALEEFIATFGEPALDEPRPGDLIWRYWHYPCSEGRIRVPVYLEEEPGQPVRVMTGKPELE
jgi:hypothetical protein